MRHRVLGCSLLAVLVLLVAACGWPSYRYGPAHTGSNDVERILGPANVAQLGERWHTSIGPSIGDQPPVVVAGVVYVATTFVESENPLVYAGRVQAFRANNGTLLWSHTIEAIPSAPSVGDGRVVVGLAGRQDGVLALDAVTGAVSWQATAVDAVPGSPAIASGRVYFATSATTAPPHDQQLAALDAATGAQVWARSIGTDGAPTGATVGGGRVYVATDDQHLIAANADDGSTIYDLLHGLQFTSPLAYRDGGLFVGLDLESVEAIDAATGQSRWLANLSGRGFDNSPAVTSDTVYVCRRSLTDNGVYAYNRADGSERWRRAGGCSSLVQANGVVYVADNGTLEALDASDGHVLLMTPLGGSLSDPIVAGGRVYVVSSAPPPDDGQLHSLALH